MPNLNITGPIPNSLLLLPNLAQVRLDSNQLMGTLPLGFGLQRRLDILNMTNNLLFGPLPSDITGLGALGMRIYLDNNLFDLCATYHLTFLGHIVQCDIGGNCTGCELAWAGCSYECILDTACDGVPPPSVGTWTCISDTWASNTSISSGDPIEIGHNVAVEGNLTAPTIVISHSDTLVNVTGCIETISLQLNLTSQDLTELIVNKITNRALLIQNGENCPPISSLPVTLLSAPCGSTLLSTSNTSPPSTLTVLFDTPILSGSSCGPVKSSSTWWIVLVSVIDSFLVLAVVAMVIYTVWRKKRFEQSRRRGVNFSICWQVQFRSGLKSVFDR